MRVVHLVRHGQIPDYETDRPLTVKGRQEALAAGQALADQVQSGEIISFYSSPTRRTRQTAALLRKGLSNALRHIERPATVMPTTAVDDRLQNLQFYLDGLGYDPIHPLFEVARWRLQQNPSAPHQACVAFHTEFWSSADPMAYWLAHPSDAAESPQAVAERIRAYLAERLNSPEQLNSPEHHSGPQRHICVAHSANLRAFLQTIFGRDPGEPPYCGMVTIKDGRVYYQGQTGEF